MIGTSDQSCWLAEACKILLLLLLLPYNYFRQLPAQQYMDQADGKIGIQAVCKCVEVRSKLDYS